MKIQNIFQLVEQTLIEISKYGGESATHMTDNDYQRVKQFLGKVLEKIRTESDTNSMHLKNLAAALQSIRNESAEKYMFGISSSIKKSAANSADREDDEKRIPAFSGPEEKWRSIGTRQAENVALVADVLDDMGYANKDYERETFRIIDSPAIARIRDIVRTGFDNGMSTVDQAYKKFDDLKHIYSGKSEHRLQPEEEQLYDQAAVKEITPNVMSFLAQIIKKRKKGEKWHEHIDPRNYENVRDKTIGYFTYDPHEAAEDLIKLNLAIKTKSGTYTLNREGIKKTVKDFIETAESLLSGATLVDPRNKTGAPGENERKVRNVIEFTKKHFSDRVWDMAQKNVFELMRNLDGSVKSALRFYIQTKDEIASNTDTQITRHQRNVERTIIGTVIDFATAKFILRKMLFDASAVLGKPKKNVPKNFVFPKDVALAGRAYSRGDHKSKSRV